MQEQIDSLRKEFQEGMDEVNKALAMLSKDFVRVDERYRAALEALVNTTIPGIKGSFEESFRYIREGVGRIEAASVNGAEKMAGEIKELKDRTAKLEDSISRFKGAAAMWQWGSAAVGATIAFLTEHILIKGPK